MHKKVLKVYPNIFWCLQQERDFFKSWKKLLPTSQEAEALSLFHYTPIEKVKSKDTEYQENTAMNSKSDWHCDYKLYYHV